MNRSMVWSEDDSRVSFEDFDFMDELNLNALININARKRVGEIKDDLRRFFTKSESTIKMRQELFHELLNNVALYDDLNESFKVLSDFFEIQKEKENVPSNEQLLFSIKIIESYVSFISGMRDIFTKYPFQSASLNNLKKMISCIYDEEEFERLSSMVEANMTSITHTKSITVGINLDAAMRPIEAGVISVNEDSYVSGDFINKIFRMRFSNDKSYECIAPLVPIDHKLSNEEYNAVRISVNSALNKVFSASLKHCASIVKKYSVEHLTQLLPLIDEWEFIVSSMTLMLELKNNRYPLCKTAIGKEDDIRGLYHPILALSYASKAPLVKNNLLFNNDAGIYILTGPNQGGKSIFTQSVGIAYAMLHLGLLLPAEKSSCRMVDAILVHFIDAKKRSYHNGRFSEECQKIQRINRFISKNSLFLFDEALSSTNATEATAISAEIITAYSELGARGIWTTHFHELCNLEDKCKDGISRICNISAMIDVDSHNRIFRIVKGDYGQSYAADIARQYCLTKEEILSEIANREHA